MYVYIYIYTYIHREREKNVLLVEYGNYGGALGSRQAGPEDELPGLGKLCVYIYIYIYIYIYYMYIYIYIYYTHIFCILRFVVRSRTCLFIHNIAYLKTKQ